MAKKSEREMMMESERREHKVSLGLRRELRKERKLEHRLRLDKQTMKKGRYSSILPYYKYCVQCGTEVWRGSVPIRVWSSWRRCDECRSKAITQGATAFCTYCRATFACSPFGGHQAKCGLCGGPEECLRKVQE